MTSTKTIFNSILLVVFSISISIAQSINLKIIESTDEHGQIYPYDFVNDEPRTNSLAQIYTYVRDERGKDDQTVLLLSGGDLLQGTPAVYYYNFEMTGTTHLLSRVMNYMGYDACAVGNHDIETGHDVYDKFLEELNFPWLAANAVKNWRDDGETYFEPVSNIQRGQFKIAVIGLITPHIPYWLPEKIWEGIEFRDMIESAKYWVDVVKQNNPDLIIGLFHSGVDYTYNGQTADTYKNENASQLVAEQVPGFDIVFVGHDHRGWNKWVTNTRGDSVLILGASSYARDVSVANVTMNKTNGSITKKITGEIVEVKNYEPDEEFMNMFAKEFDIVKEYVSQQIGEFTQTISSRESIFGESAFNDLIHTIQLDLTGADISFTAPLSMNAEIEAGMVFVRNMFELYRYENLLYTMELSGEEIKNYLEYSYSLWFNTMLGEDDHLLKFKTDENGNYIYSKRDSSLMLENVYYNFDDAEGINYTVDVSKPVGERVTIFSTAEGSEFLPGKKYKAAINSYRGNGGGGHLTEGAGIPKEKLSERILYSSKKDLRYYLMKWIEHKGTVNSTTSNNWKIIPENYWFKGMKRDYNILFK